MRKQRILSLILLCAVLWLTAAPAVAATRYSDGVYTFEKTEYNNAVITDCALTDSEIIIPDFVLDYPVIGIGDYAFMSNSTVKTVTMPLSVIRIGEYAFANDPDLESVTIPRWCDRIADNAFWNSPNVVISCYTDTAAQAYAEAHEIPYILLDAPVPKTDISTAAVMLEAEAYRYDGTEHFPAVTVSLDDVILNPETDYTVAYADNQLAGCLRRNNGDAVDQKGIGYGIGIGRNKDKCIDVGHRRTDEPVFPLLHPVDPPLPVCVHAALDAVAHQR